jgi:hypothetical protein
MARQTSRSNASSTINEPLGGTTDGEASRPAKAFDLIRLDRFACCRFELYYIMAIADEDAGYRDGRASVCHQGTKLLCAALIMHVPVHRDYSRDLSGGSIDLGQSVKVNPPGLR